MDETKALQVLHLEDDTFDAELVRLALARHDYQCDVRVVNSTSDYLDALDQGGFDIILSDNGVPGFQGIKALEIAREKLPEVPFLFISGDFGSTERVQNLKSGGAIDCILKSDLGRLAPAVQRALRTDVKREARDGEMRYLRGMERLVEVVQELSLARNLETVVAIVRHTARELTGADGATCILREGEQCHYVDEEAIAPLWKGQRFPLEACISGWSMINRRPAVIEDIYADSRIPHDAYRPTFVKSLAMVPIRTLDPIGAIGNYWAYTHQPTEQEVKLLQALADTTAVALENVRVYGELERRVRDRTAELEEANRELSAFSYAVSHDLRAPVRHITGFADLLLENSKDGLDGDGFEYLDSIRKSAGRMHQLIEDLLELSRTMQSPVKRERVDLSRTARELADQLQMAFASRRVEFVIQDDLAVEGDAGLLRIVLENLFSNAWKFTSKKDAARIEFGASRLRQGELTYYVRDNGAGFDMRYAGRLFNVFQRLHANDDFPGTGVGLATVQRIVRKHSGRIWTEAIPNQGATFFFTLDGARPEGPARASSIWTG